MKVDTLKAALTYVTVLMVLGGAFYGLVLYPFQLDPLVQGALIAAATAAYTFAFGQEIAKQTSAAGQRAYDKGLSTPVPEPPVEVVEP